MENKEIAKQIIEDTAKRLLHGITHKNVLRHLVSIGINESLANNMLDLAEKLANKSSHYKIGKYSKEYKYVG